MRCILFTLLALGLTAQDQTDLDKALSSSRRRIDNIDDQIVKLLNERATIVRKVGLAKLRFHAPATAPGRNEQVLRRVSERARPPLGPESVRRIYETIIAEMTAMEKQEMEKPPRDK